MRILGFDMYETLISLYFSHTKVLMCPCLFVQYCFMLLFQKTCETSL